MRTCLTLLVFGLIGLTAIMIKLDRDDAVDNPIFVPETPDLPTIDYRNFYEYAEIPHIPLGRLLENADYRNQTIVLDGCISAICLASDRYNSITLTAGDQAITCYLQCLVGASDLKAGNHISVGGNYTNGRMEFCKVITREFRISPVSPSGPTE